MSFKRSVSRVLDPKEEYFWNSLEDPQDKLPESRVFHSPRFSEDRCKFQKERTVLKKSRPLV